MLSENANQKRDGGIAKFWHTDWLVRMRRKRSSFWFTLALALFADSAWAQLPDGPGKEETQRICKNCHELERSVSRRQDRDGWQITLDKMETLGAEMTDEHDRAPEMTLGCRLNGFALEAVELHRQGAAHLGGAVPTRGSCHASCARSSPMEAGWSV